MKGPPGFSKWGSGPHQAWQSPPNQNASCPPHALPSVSHLGGAGDSRHDAITVFSKACPELIRDPRPLIRHSRHPFHILRSPPKGVSLHPVSVREPPVTFHSFRIPSPAPIVIPPKANPEGWGEGIVAGGTCPPPSAASSALHHPAPSHPILNRGPATPANPIIPAHTRRNPRKARTAQPSRTLESLSGLHQLVEDHCFEDIM